MGEIGLLKTAAVSPVLKVANPDFNTDEIIKYADEAYKNGAGVVLFPELSITAYTCGDLFFQDILYKKTMDNLQRVVDASKSIKSVIIAGFPFKVENNIYNCAGVIQNGEIKGIVPKMFVPNYKEFYEARWFAYGYQISHDVKSVNLFNRDIPFGNLIFCDEKNGVNFGIEICEDMWVPISPGAHLVLNGAHVLFNPSASNEMVGKAEYRKGLILNGSGKNQCGYVYASSGVHESTTDLVFGGECIIAENATVISESDRFSRDTTIVYGEIDIERLKFERSHGQNFEQCTTAYSIRNRYSKVKMEPIKMISTEDKIALKRQYPKNPFVPAQKEKVHERCSEIFNIQAAGLAKRIEHTGSEKVVIGISGGLDSTLALLVAVETFELLKRDFKNIIAITMPGFGTTGKTYNNAQTLMKLLNTDMREISIKESVMQHFGDIQHDPSILDVTYENSQARERTQILMDIANKERGLVIGTGDLSEVALGWSTYNGDHMSMYGVNSSIPKTLVRFVIEWVMENKLSEDQILKDTLRDILDTPISPELLPPDKEGKIAQKTEDTVGPYILHDFFLYYTLRFGMNPKKLLYIAERTFDGDYDSEEIKKWLKLFYRRFFTQQFKRSCIPDGPKVGSVSLSPRGDFRMPSDADYQAWIMELE